MIISNRRKFIFVCVSKTGSTSIEKQLRDFAEVSVPKHTRLCDLKRLTGIDHKAYFKFCFTRNPWDRAVSIFLQLQKPADLKCEFRRRRYDLAVSRSFKEFVGAAEKNWPGFWTDRSVESHTRGESGRIKIDFLGRYENLQSDFEAVCERLGIPKSKLPRLNVSAKKDYAGYYDAPSREAIALYFREDIECGGYFFENKTLSGVCHG